MEQTDTTPSSKSSGSSGRILALALIGGFAILGFWFLSQKPASDSMPATPVAESPSGSQVSTTEARTDTGMAPAEVLDIQVEGGSFYFKPDVIRVKRGQKVKVTLTSVGGMPHDFVIDELEVKTEKVTDSSTSVEFTPDQVGTFEYYCSVGQHRQQGMKGQLIVE